jgi:hypothetical protein
MVKLSVKNTFRKVKITVKNEFYAADFYKGVKLFCYSLQYQN